jgi:hypothetical protein
MITFFVHTYNDAVCATGFYNERLDACDVM